MSHIRCDLIAYANTFCSAEMPGMYQLALFLAATHTTIRRNYIIDNDEFNRRSCSFFERNLLYHRYFGGISGN